MSLEAGYSHGDDFEGLCEKRDAIDAKATNAVIIDLPDVPKQAIKSFYLGERWTSHFMLSACVTQGVEAVAAGLRRRGII